MTGSLSTLIEHTTWGQIRVLVSDGGIVSCDLPIIDKKPTGTFRINRAEIKSAHPAHKKVMESSDAFIRALFAGKSMKKPSISLQKGTAFQREVWKFLAGMKTGELVTYGELASKIGHAKAVRAIGQACGANPIPLFIPCHRVSAANGKLGGFSSGLAWKVLLLEIEKADLAAIRRPS